ncbi:Cytochrome P450 84A1 [Nymphaea thermarum]|nr:Cytochrome P450 84A1 [Nymphaea thermarum]
MFSLEEEGVKQVLYINAFDYSRISISDVCESPSCKNQWWKEKRVRRSASTFGRLTPALERWKHGGVENLKIITNDHGNRMAHSYVAMNPTNAIVGLSIFPSRVSSSLAVENISNNIMFIRNIPSHLLTGRKEDAKTGRVVRARAATGSISSHRQGRGRQTPEGCLTDNRGACPALPTSVKLERKKTSLWPVLPSLPLHHCHLHQLRPSSCQLEVILSLTTCQSMHNPGEMLKLQEELKREVGLDRQVQEGDMERLVQLKRVLKETLRLHPPIP